jgi:hypothetical protein
MRRDGVRRHAEIPMHMLHLHLVLVAFAAVQPGEGLVHVHFRFEELGVFAVQVLYEDLEVEVGFVKVEFGSRRVVRSQGVFDC